MNLRTTLRGACTALALALASTTVDAQLFRAYVASDGNDSAPCTLLAPCRLLPAALTAVANGGEIWMLDSANFNTSTVTITKSVTILAIPGAMGSIVSTGGAHGININTPGVYVTLRNLVIVDLGSSSRGVNFTQGSQLNVIDCEFNNLQASSISAEAPGSLVTVKNSVMRNSVNGVSIVGSVTASIDNVQAVGNSSGVYVGSEARVTVSNSVLSGGSHGVRIVSTAGTAKVVVRNSVLTGNGIGLYVAVSGAGSLAQVMAIGNTISNNDDGIQMLEAASTAATVVLDGNAIADNATSGVNFSSGTPVAYSRGNNTFRFNGSNLVGGVLTAMGEM